MLAALDYIVEEIARAPQNRKVKKYLDEVTYGKWMNERNELQDLTYNSLGS